METKLTSFLTQENKTNLPVYQTKVIHQLGYPGQQWQTEISFVNPRNGEKQVITGKISCRKKDSRINAVKKALSQLEIEKIETSSTESCQSLKTRLNRIYYRHGFDYKQYPTYTSSHPSGEESLWQSQLAFLDPQTFKPLSTLSRVSKSKHDAEEDATRQALSLLGVPLPSASSSGEAQVPTEPVFVMRKELYTIYSMADREDLQPQYETRSWGNRLETTVSFQHPMTGENLTALGDLAADYVESADNAAKKALTLLQTQPVVVRPSENRKTLLGRVLLIINQESNPEFLVKFLETHYPIPIKLFCSESYLLRSTPLPEGVERVTHTSKCSKNMRGTENLLSVSLGMFLSTKTYDQIIVVTRQSQALALREVVGLLDGGSTVRVISSFDQL